MEEFNEDAFNKDIDALIKFVMVISLLFLLVGGIAIYLLINNAYNPV